MDDRFSHAILLIDKDCVFAGKRDARAPLFLFFKPPSVCEIVKCEIVNFFIDGKSYSRSEILK